MKLTPLDVDQQQFQRVFRGCDPDQVQRFLELVSREMEELIREARKLEDEVRRRDQQLVEFRGHESQLREALVAAGRMTDELRDAARREGELVVAEAQLKAQKIIQEATERTAALNGELHEMRRQKARAVVELRSILDSHRRLLDTHDEIDRESNALEKTVQGARKP
ncbi:MAG: DivIVA domain-containing protein [Myxococcales bacterium]|nr:DivIVA domain-containing protein [Myxococcales bacterium]